MAEITYRSAGAADEPFIRSLILEITAAEAGAALWPDSMREALLEAQYQARRQGIAENHPGAEEEILCMDGTDAGWTAIDRSGSEIRLVEIAVVPEFRRIGIATARIRELLREADAAAKPIRLSVTPRNPAMRLYARLGFRVIDGDEVRVRMERMPARRAARKS